MTDLPAADQPNIEPAPHTWVQITTLPVHPELNADGGIDLSVESDQSEEIALEQAKVGCWFCGETINTETINTPCKGM